MKAALFPGQGAQFSGMGKSLYDTSDKAKTLFHVANDVLGFNITEIMFSGTEEALQKTEVTQPAVFIHSVIDALVSENFSPNMVAGHSLGEFSALVAAQCLSFEDALKLVSIRAKAMQYACEVNVGTMAAVLGLDDAVVEKICTEITEEIVVAANYNCIGQIVISGSVKGIELASEKLKTVGAKRVLPLKVGGAFHSPLMQPAAEKLAAAIEETTFSDAVCPIYQNVYASPETQAVKIKQNLLAQLTAPVRFTASVQRMIADGTTEFTEYGPGKVLSGLVKKIDATVVVL